MLLRDYYYYVELLNCSRISSSLSAMFAAISSTVKIVSFSPISASVETDSRDFVLSGGEAQLS